MPIASATGGALEALGVPRRDEWFDGLRQGLLVACAILVMVLPPPKAPASVQRAEASLGQGDVQTLRDPDFGDAAVSPEARQLAQGVLQHADHGRLPFVIIDKKQAQVLVFDASGRLLGASPVLLGYAPGDETVAGIGQRPIDQVKPHERTTPAGRFVAESGRNALHEDVVWVDYEAAVSMHRVRLTDPTEHRLERLASATPSDNRISYGCLNLPPEFFEQVLWPTMRGRGNVVYVLPEVKPLAEVFPGLV